MHAARAESAPPVPAIALSGVSAGYGRLVAARGVSLAVHAGETLGLIGLNGAGKTTLIKAIAGLRGVQAGTIAVAGAALAYLPERFEPPWFLTGLEFLRFSTRLYGLALPRARFEDEATRIDLAPEALARRTGTYSKGMRQKLGLLATLLTERQTLLLDEPMSGLDPIARATTKALLRDARGAGRTVLLSSHILADMDEICDRVAVLHDREIRFVGTPADLRAAGGGGSLEQAFLRFIREGGSVGGDESA